MSLSLSLKPRVLRTYDSDAAAYISAVESADGESLESGVKDAINEFVIGCKIRGIWDAIKSCCLLSGARTISGATVPLKGNAPILTSFVGNYNRETGLQRTGGAFSINRNNNADPQNNKHVAVYPTSIDYGSSDSNSRSILTGSTTSGSTFFTVNSLGLSVRVNTSLSIVVNQPVFAGNLIGVSILDSSRSQLLYNSTINIININTTTPATTDLSLFAGGGVSTSLSRVAFYSVGESLNLKLLNDAVKQYIKSINLYINSSLVNELDNDALAYINSVENADNQELEFSIKNSINNFVIGCKNDGLWDSIKSCSILMGAKTLNGALVPLVGQPVSNSNFTNNDYNRYYGLKGNGSTKYLDTNRLNNTDPQNNRHICVFKSGGFFNGGTLLDSGGTNSDSGLYIGLGFFIYRINGSFNNPAFFSLDDVFLGSARPSSSILEGYINGTKITSNISSTAPSANSIRVFSRGSTGDLTNARIAFYSIGEFLNLELLYYRVFTLYNSIKILDR